MILTSESSNSNNNKLCFIKNQFSEISKIFFKKTSVQKIKKNIYIKVLSVENMYKNFQSFSFLRSRVTDIKKTSFFTLIYNKHENKLMQFFIKIA